MTPVEAQGDDGDDVAELFLRHVTSCDETEDCPVTRHCIYGDEN